MKLIFENEHEVADENAATFGDQVARLIAVASQGELAVTIIEGGTVERLELKIAPMTPELRAQAIAELRRQGVLPPEADAPAMTDEELRRNES